MTMKSPIQEPQVTENNVERTAPVKAVELDTIPKIVATTENKPNGSDEIPTIQESTYLGGWRLYTLIFG